MMDKDNNDIKKELEELEKLIEKVKKQNEEEKKKQLKGPRNTVVRINIASTYSSNFWINMIFSLLVNFILVFIILKTFAFVEVENDIYIVAFVILFTIIEEYYKKYLLTKKIRIVLFTSGLIFTFINLVLVYLLDLIVFGNDFSFKNYVYPIVFLFIFQIIRALFKNLYIKGMYLAMFKKIRK